MATVRDEAPIRAARDAEADRRYAWVALSVTTLGALLAALAGLGAADRAARHPGRSSTPAS